MILEDWMRARIKRAFAEETEFQAACGHRMPSEPSRREITAYQLYRCNRMIDYASRKSVFYRGLADRFGPLQSLDDLARLPFTTPEDLADGPYRLLCISQSEIARVFSHTTTGTTTGRLKKVFFTRRDAGIIAESMTEIMKTVFAAVGLDWRGRTVMIYLPNNGPPFSIAGLIAQGVENMGSRPILGDCAATTAQQIEAVKAAAPEMLMGSAFRIWRLTQESRHDHDLGAMGVKALFITSEYLSTPMRQRLAEVWQAEVFHHYGMTEPGFVIGVECQAHDGFHYNETDLLFEAVDPETGQSVEEGAEGELVFTTLNREGMPLIRYRTGDVAALIRRPCACGASSLTKIGAIPKRTALISPIGQGALYSSLLDEALYDLPELVDYRVFLHHGSERDSMTCQVEIVGPPDSLKEKVIQRLMRIPVVAKEVGAGRLEMPVIESVGRGKLRRGGRSMKRRIVDCRE